MDLREGQPTSPQAPAAVQEQPCTHFVQLREFCVIRKKRGKKGGKEEEGGAEGKKEKARKERARKEKARKEEREKTLIVRNGTGN